MMFKLRDPISAYLSLSGLMFVLIGVSWLLFPSHSREAGVDWSPVMTTNIAGVVWIIGGLCGLVTGTVFKNWRAVGFRGLQGASLLMTLLFLCSAIIGIIPEDVIAGGRPESIITAISYGTFWVSAVVMSQVSGLIGESFGEVHD